MATANLTWANDRITQARALIEEVGREAYRSEAKHVAGHLSGALDILDAVLNSLHIAQSLLGPANGSQENPGGPADILGG